MKGNGVSATAAEDGIAAPDIFSLGQSKGGIGSLSNQEVIRSCGGGVNLNSILNGSDGKGEGGAVGSTLIIGNGVGEQVRNRLSGG